MELTWGESYGYWVPPEGGKANVTQLVVPYYVKISHCPIP